MLRNKAVIVGIVVIIGLSGCADVGSQRDKDTIQKTTNSPVETAEIDDRSILTEEELYMTVVDDDSDQYNESLYYISENGTWYHVDSNSTIGDQRPSGNVIPFFENESINLTTEQRPAYVWKLTRTAGCSALAIYNASSGQEMESAVQPQCPSISNK